MASPSRWARFISWEDASFSEPSTSDCLSVTLATEVTAASVSSRIAEIFSMACKVEEPVVSMSVELLRILVRFSESFSIRCFNVWKDWEVAATASACSLTIASAVWVARTASCVASVI